MSWQRRTVWFVCAVVLVIVAYDVVAYSQGGIPATVSSLIHNQAYAVPAIPFAFGLLMGHFFL